MSLKLQKRLAASLLGCGKKRVWPGVPVVFRTGFVAFGHRSEGLGWARVHGPCEGEGNEPNPKMAS